MIEFDFCFDRFYESLNQSQMVMLLLKQCIKNGCQFRLSLTSTSDVGNTNVGLRFCIRAAVSEQEFLGYVHSRQW